MVFLQHLHIWVVWETFFADRREVGRLPPAAVQVGLDLGRHAGSGGTMTGERLWHVKQAWELECRCVWVDPAPVQLWQAFSLRRRPCFAGAVVLRGQISR
jgi:hypothetical protein